MIVEVDSWGIGQMVGTGMDTGWGWTKLGGIARGIRGKGDMGKDGDGNGGGVEGLKGELKVVDVTNPLRKQGAELVNKPLVNTGGIGRVGRLEISEE